MNVVDKTLLITGMSCVNCEVRIESALGKLEGVEEVSASFSKSSVMVTYDSDSTDLDKIRSLLESLGYRVEGEAEGQSKTQHRNGSINRLLGIGIIVAAVYIIVTNTLGFNFVPKIDQSMGYGILFLVGMVTSLHCVAMCGGINLSQCISSNSPAQEIKRLERLKPSLMYNAGRVISYSVIGGAAGALGSVISFSGGAKGVVIVISGVLMVVVGLNMLGLAPWLRRISPRMPRVFGDKVYRSTGYHPFYIGLLNGLMPCGPLQAMQLYALGTGSFFAGALSMLIFGLGTVPLMFSLGAVSTFLSSRFTHRLSKAGAVLVMVLGLIMVSRGFNLLGFDTAIAAPAFPGAGARNVARIEGNFQTVTIDLEPGSYSPIVVQKGIPVRWTIKAETSDLNGCNNPIIIPEYNLEKTLVPGNNVIEFVPADEGKVTYTCWMGMISSNITVVEDLSSVNPGELKDNSSEPVPVRPGGGSCCQI